MKTKSIKRQHRWMIIVITVSFLVAAAFIATYWFVKNNEITKQQDLSKAIAVEIDRRIAEIESKKSEPVYIKLPGAEAFKATVEDYTQATSLWKMVNKQEAISKSYIPDDLTTPGVPIRANATSDERKVRAVVALKLEELFAKAEKAGHSLMVGSAYRSGATQDALFNGYVASAGLEVAQMYSARPGHSEHQLGLAVDISNATQDCYLSECFLGTPEGQWLANNAHEFGFTLRYPKGKEDITGYNFEPWHYRYVGVDLATALYKSGLTLEEAWPYLTEALDTLRENRAL